MDTRLQGCCCGGLMAILLSVLCNSREGREETHLAQERNTMKSFDPVHKLKSCV